MSRFLAFFLFFGLVVAYPQNPQFTALTIDQDLRDNADSVIREEVITYDLTHEERMTKTIHRVITVLKKAGNGDVQAYAFYDDDRKVKNLSAVIYDRTGREIKEFKERDFKDVSAVPGGQLYADSRALYLDYTPMRYPYTVVFDAEVKSRTTAFIPFWVPVSNYESSTQYAKLEILCRPEDELNIKQERLDDYDVAYTHSPGREIWEVNHIKALKKEYRSPDLGEVMPRVKCALKSFYLKGVKGTATNWEEYGKWMDANLIQGTEELPQETKNTIMALVSGLENDREKAKAIYQYVQDKVRYVGVQVGIGGWKPMLAADVDHLGYGDCKALSNYTKSLLNVAGVPSYYTVLYGDDSKRSIDSDFIAMQGNHVILGVPLDNKMTWLECTSQEVPFGYIGDFTDDRDVLVIKDTGGEIAHTTIYPAVGNRKILKADLKLGAKGTLEGMVNRTSSGVFYGDCLRLNRLDNDELKKHYLNEWGNIGRLRVKEIRLENLRDSVTFNENVSISAANYLTRVGNDYLLRPNMFAMSQRQLPPRNTARKTNFIIQRGSVDSIQLSYELPESLTVDVLPGPVSIATDFGTYSATFSLEKNTIIYTRSFSLNEGNYSPERYDAFRDFYKKIWHQDSQKLLIKPQT